MDNQTPEEQFIAQAFSRLPRRTLVTSQKQQVWLKIHNHILQAKLETQTHDQKIGVLDVLALLFLRRKLAKAAVTVFIVILALTLVRSSANATPGETLYQVKKAAEQVEKVIAFNDEARVKVNVKHARRRLAEVKILVEENKDGKIVTDTLEQLKNTTQEIEAVTEAKPELANHAVELAQEQEQILVSVEGQGGDDIKEAVHTAIAEARQSLSRLTPEEVKGEVTEELTSGTPSSTPVVAPRGLRSKPKIKDGMIESPILIDEVIRINEKTQEPEDIEILPEPTLKF